MSRDLETTAFITFCYVLKMLDVWEDVEQLANDVRVFLFCINTLGFSQEDIKVYNE